MGTRTPLPGTAGMKDATNCVSSPAASGAAAVTRSVGPPLLVTWTLGVIGVWPSFFSLTRTSVASRRSQRPAGGFRASHCSPLASGKTTESDCPGAATPAAVPLASIWVFASIVTPGPSRKPFLGLMRMAAGSTGGFSPAGPPATSDSTRNDDAASALPVNIRIFTISFGFSAIAGLVAEGMAEDHRDRAALPRLEVDLLAVPGRIVPIALVIHAEGEEDAPSRPC